MDVKENREFGKLGCHFGALFVMAVWGTTFIVTKLLLEDFRPVEIIMVRFVIGYVTLAILSRKMLRTGNFKLEFLYAMMGLLGISLYYLLENTALTYTYAANVGIIIATIPFFTALMAFLFYKERSKLTIPFFLGFIMAMVGIAFISLNGAKLQMNPLGDFLTVLAALSWAGYNMVLRKIQSYGPFTLAGNRRIFFWGIVFILPVWLWEGKSEGFSLAFSLRNVLLLLFLGVLACAICYVLWNKAVETLGAVETNLYIYLNPVFTLIASRLVLKEKLTPQAILGTGLILAGLLLSEVKPKEKKGEADSKGE